MPPRDDKPIFDDVRSVSGRGATRDERFGERHSPMGDYPVPPGYQRATPSYEGTYEQQVVRLGAPRKRRPVGHKEPARSTPPAPTRKASPSGPFVIDQLNDRFGSIGSFSGPGGPPYRQPEPYSRSGPGGYDYRQDRVLGRAPMPFGAAFAQMAMGALQADPNRFFPFRVIGAGGEQEIILGRVYDLTNRENSPIFPLPPGRFPIRVTEVTANSFTFTTLPGHFDPPGSTITFTIFPDPAGMIHLEHLGVTAPSADLSLMYPAAPYMAGKTWDIQAANLREFLERR